MKARIVRNTEHGQKDGELKENRKSGDSFCGPALQSH